MKEMLYELLTDTYKQTVNDNKKDFEIIFKIIGKICTYLILKNVITQEEAKDILNIKENTNEETN